MLDILLVDEDAAARLSVADALSAAGHQVTIASNSADAAALSRGEMFHAVITRLLSSAIDGMALFDHLGTISPATAVILIVATPEVADAKAALRQGVADYVIEPVDPEEVVLRVSRLDELRTLQQELEEIRAGRRDRGAAAEIVGRSPVMARLIEQVDSLAASKTPVLIIGESGTGKALFARSLHELSQRRQAPFVAVSCAAFPEALLEAELFRRDGPFEAASGGTLFLDDVAEMSPQAQERVLQVLDNGRLTPLGTSTPVTVDVRLLSATRRKLRQRVDDGRFRRDLFERLGSITLGLPPLRERTGDIPLLVEHFLRRLVRDKPAPELSRRAWTALGEYAFPGNVRELEHAVEHAVVLASGAEIDLEHLPSDIAGLGVALPGSESGFRSLAAAVKQFEREYLLKALAIAGNKRTRTADLLGISRKNLWEKLRSHGITESRVED